MRLYYQTIGSGEPLVVLHGLFGSGDNWLSFAQRFADRFRVVLPDARNHGLSPHHPEMSYPLMAADLLELLAEQGIGAARLLAHSMGGKAAMEFALTHGEMVRSLVVVDIAPRAYDPRHEQILEALCGLDLERYLHRREIEHALADAIPDLAVRRFLLKSLTRKEPRGFRWKLGLHEIKGNYSRLNEGLAGGRSWGGPCLFVRGENSDYVCEADRAAISGLFPTADLRTIAGAGHWVHAEAPGPFESLVSGFLV